MIHKPVLVKELVDNLNLRPGMTVVDGTLGAGGHSIEILRRILPGGKLISIDWDRAAVAEFEKYLNKKGIAVSAKKERYVAKLANERAGQESPTPVKSNANDENISPLAFVPLFSGDKIVGYWCGANDNYANLHKIIRELKPNTVDAIFADLGFSSDQIEDSRRGFSFQKNGPLDMRYSSAKQKTTGADVINNYSEKELADIFWKFGEEKYSRKIAAAIAKVRKNEKIEETQQLVQIIRDAVPDSYKHGRIHFATRVFQALRIEVNQELENLRKFLNQSVAALANEGRLAVISFHSLEDRIVKNFFQKESRDCICPMDYLRCVCSHKAKIKIITKKPIIPNTHEIRSNPRARSAKLRIAEII